MNSYLISFQKKIINKADFFLNFKLNLQNNGSVVGKVHEQNVSSIFESNFKNSLFFSKNQFLEKKREFLEKKKDNEFFTFFFSKKESNLKNSFFFFFLGSTKESYALTEKSFTDYNVFKDFKFISSYNFLNLKNSFFFNFFSENNLFFKIKLAYFTKKISYTFYFIRLSNIFFSKNTLIKKKYPQKKIVSLIYFVNFFFYAIKFFVFIKNFIKLPLFSAFVLNYKKSKTKIQSFESVRDILVNHSLEKKNFYSEKNLTQNNNHKINGFFFNFKKKIFQKNVFLMKKSFWNLFSKTQSLETERNDLRNWELKNRLEYFFQTKHLNEEVATKEFRNSVNHLKMGFFKKNFSYLNFLLSGKQNDEKFCDNEFSFFSSKVESSLKKTTKNGTKTNSLRSMNFFFVSQKLKKKKSVFQSNSTFIKGIRKEEFSSINVTSFDRGI